MINDVEIGKTYAHPGSGRAYKVEKIAPERKSRSLMCVHGKQIAPNGDEREFAIGLENFKKKFT